MTEKATLRVYRYNPDRDQKPYYREYEVPVDKAQTLLDALFYIQENLDPTLTSGSSAAPPFAAPAL